MLRRLLIFSSLSLFSPLLFAIDSIGNLGSVNDNIHRGEILDEESDYRQLSELGINTVVNLRAKKDPDNEAWCKKYNLNCTLYPINLSYPGSDRRFNYEMLKKAFYFTLREVSESKKVYIHCHYGSDRTGALAAALTLREITCGKEYNADETWEKIYQDLSHHNFHEHLFPTLLANIKSWVYDHPEWLCLDPS